MMNQARAFGPKGKPAAGGGGAAAAPYVEPKKIATVFEKMIEHGGIEQFMFGPPKGISQI